MENIFHAYFQQESKLETRPKLWKEDSVYALNFVLCIMLRLELQNLFPSPSLSLLPFSMCNWEEFSTLSLCEIFSYTREYLYVTFKKKLSKIKVYSEKK